MAKYRYSRLSLSRIAELEQPLQILCKRLIADPRLPCDISVLCGHRDETAQNTAYAKGASKLKYPRSKHNRAPSHAVDIAPWVDGCVCWDWAWYHRLAPVVMAIWGEMTADEKGGFSLIWGGSWKNFQDGPHYELS